MVMGTRVGREVDTYPFEAWRMAHWDAAAAAGLREG